MKTVFYFLAVLPSALCSLPSGFHLTEGDASILSEGNGHLELFANDQAVIDWENFSIAPDEIVQFIQPNSRSIALNRVLGSESSAIFGQLSAHGQIIVINPNGIVIGAEGRIDTAGLIASTLPLDLESFRKNSELKFSGTTGAIQILGTIRSKEAVFVSPEIDHRGSIFAESFAALLAAGGASYTLGNPASLDLKDVSKTLSLGGEVFSPGGRIALLGEQVRVEGRVDVSHEKGGGTVLIGGRLGGLPVESASEWVWISQEARINADAIQDGPGGSLFLWANQGLCCWGDISARGGANGGDGGFIEVSSGQGMDFNWRADASALLGRPGNILLDPTNVVINNSPTTGMVVFGVPTSWPPATNPVQIRFSDLNTALSTMNVTITTNVLPDPGASGDITVSSVIPAPFINWSSGTTLQLLAARDILIESQILDSTAAATNANRIVINAGRNITMGTVNTAIVGSQNGGTQVVAGVNLAMGGTNRSAQIGFRLPSGQTASGPIAVDCARLDMACGIGSGVGSQIGHGNFTTAVAQSVATVLTGAVNPNIDVRVRGNLTMVSGTVTANAAHIGHGAFRLSPGAASNQTGNISLVCDGNLFMNNQNGGGSNLLAVGHGAELIDAGGVNSVTGNIDVSVGGTLNLRGGDTGACQCIIGHHALFTGGTIISTVGNINVCCGGDATLRSGGFGSSFTVIGHTSVGPDPGTRTVTGNYVVNIGGNLDLINGVVPPSNGSRSYIGGLEVGPGFSSQYLCNLGLSVCGNLTMSCANVSGGTLGVGFATPVAGSMSQVDVTVGGSLTALNVASAGTVVSSAGDLNLAVTGGISLSIGAAITNQMRLAGAGATRVYCGGNLLANGGPTGNNVRIGVYIVANQPSTLIDVRAGGDLQWTTNYISTITGGITALAGHSFGPGELWTSNGTQILTVCGQPSLIPFLLNCSNCALFTVSSASTSPSCGAFSVQAAPNGPTLANFNTSGPLAIGSFCRTCTTSVLQSLSIGSVSGTDQVNIPVNPTSLLVGPFENVTVRIPLTTTAGPISLSACNNLNILTGSNLTALAAGAAISLLADSDLSGLGNLNLAANVTTNNGPISLNAGFGGPVSSLSSINQTAGAVSSGMGAILAQAGYDITVNGAPISFLSSSGNIDMAAQNTISVLRTVSSTAGGNINLHADFDNTGVGNLLVSGSVLTTTGNICLEAGSGTFGCSQSNCRSGLISGFPVGSCTVSITGNAVSSMGGSITVVASQNIQVNGLSPSISTSGPIAMTAGFGDLTVQQQVISTGSSLTTFAGNDTMLTQTGASPLIQAAGEIRMITGLDMTLNPNTAILSTGPGDQVTLIVDNIHSAFPAFPAVDSGSFTMLAGSSVTSGSPLRIFTAYSQVFGSGAGINFIDPTALLNGQNPYNAPYLYPIAAFTDTPYEQWCVFFGCPSNYPSPNLGVPFTIFYKLCLAPVVQQAMVVVTEFLLDLHPYNEFPGWMERFWIQYDPELGKRTPSNIVLDNEPYYFRRRNLNIINQPKSFTLLTQ